MRIANVYAQLILALYFDAVYILYGPAEILFIGFLSDSQLASYGRAYKQTSSNQHANLHTVVVGHKGCRKEAI